MSGRASSYQTLACWAVLCALLLTNVLTLIILRDNENLKDFWTDPNSSALRAYEDRIAELSMNVDRLRSREIINSGTATLRDREFIGRQAQLEDQLLVLEMLAKTALPPELVQRPQPNEGPARPVTGGASATGQFDLLEENLRVMEEEIGESMTLLSDAMDRSVETIVAELRRVGHEPAISELALGGPFLDASEFPSGFDTPDITNILTAMGRLEEARRAMDEVPIHKPIGTTRISSAFGLRQDPFTGQSAFHSGIDFPAPTGTPILSAGGGAVTFVGWKGAYGRVVEITHASGLMSRYPHLSRALVEQGDEVEADMVIALVGSTGRSTGPHLHFEIRDGNSAIDPTPYLAAGRRLEVFDPWFTTASR
ncbi:MAG: M23 family metallopeptidase [Pelagibacterium sp.]|uniref:M23 family metallopeptidase n=1 Tax=Pelagibacterium sp. TaxID=1967288 RepID=UPI0032EB1C19